MVFRCDRLNLRYSSASLGRILLRNFTYGQYTQDCISQKKTLLCLVEKYYKLSGNLRKLQRNWFARPINSFASWTVDELRYWLRTAKRILTKNKLSPPSKLQELKKHTILADKNTKSESTHLLHKILPVQSLHNYKNTPITRFFSSTAAGTDIKNQLPTNNLQKSCTDSRSTLSTLTPPAEQRDSFSQIHKNPSNSTFRMHELPATISIPYQIVFRPYLLPSTKICRSFSNDFLLPLAQKKNPRIAKPRTSTDTKNTIPQFFISSKKSFVHRTSSP